MEIPAAGAPRTHLDPERESRRRTIALTWISYASYYFTRQHYFVAKKSIERETGIDAHGLGRIDTSYAAAYAAGQFFWGIVADAVGARRVIAVGMLATAAISVAVGLSSSFSVFFVLLGLNGLAQSSGWPANLKALTMWLPSTARGRIMGMWSTCYQLGSLVAKPVAGILITASVLGWRLAFFAPAVWVGLVGIVVFAALPERKAPTEPQAQASKEAPAPSDAAAIRAERNRVLRTPLVWALGASYFFMKLIRYMLFFWLSYYMEDALHYTTRLASIVPLSFEVGGILGAITIGYLSDRWFGGKRLGVGITFLVLLAGAMHFFAVTAPLGVAYNVISLALVGFCLFGPDTLLSATAAQDIGGRTAAATAAGIINGVGSVGPIIGGYFAARLTARLGWTNYFSLLGSGGIVAALVILPFYFRERAGKKHARTAVP
jgi:sugar phosphate permease